MEASDFLEMARSLVCVLDNDTVIQILLNEGYLQVDIEEFITDCEI